MSVLYYRLLYLNSNKRLFPIDRESCASKGHLCITCKLLPRLQTSWSSPLDDVLERIVPYTVNGIKEFSQNVTEKFYLVP